MRYSDLHIFFARIAECSSIMFRGTTTAKEEEVMKEWVKPQTIFASFFYYTFLVQISCGIDPHPLLIKIVSGLFIFYYGKQTVKTLLKAKGAENEKTQ